MPPVPLAPWVTGSLANVSADEDPDGGDTLPPLPFCGAPPAFCVPDYVAPTGSSTLGIHLFLPGLNHLSLGSLL